jgi:hypothetical protein
MGQLNYSIKYKPIIITSFVAQLAAYLYNWFSSPAGHLFAAYWTSLRDNLYFRDENIYGIKVKC